MNKSDVGLLLPGTRVQIGSRWLGKGLYGISDPVDEAWNALLDSVVTVKKVRAEDGGHIEVYIEEEDDIFVLIEEIDHIVDSFIDDTIDLEQSDVPLSILY